MIENTHTLHHVLLSFDKKNQPQKCYTRRVRLEADFSQASLLPVVSM